MQQASVTRNELELRAAAGAELRRRALEDKTVYEIVAANKTVLRHIQRNPFGVFEEVHGKIATVSVPEKLEPVLTVHRKYVIIYGGRGGAKSMTIMDILAAETKDDNGKTMCFREVQKSLKESVFAGIEGEIKRIGFSGYDFVPSQSEIRHEEGGLFSFWGLNANLTNMKSLWTYKRFWTEEAEATSQKSLDTMGPTLRGVPGAQLFFSFNPSSSADPIYNQFIKPYEKQLNKDGIYIDDYHLIIKIGWQDNPWFMDDESLREELEKDQKKVNDGLMTQSKLDHIWGGEPDDDVENAIISTEWFDACVDAHKDPRFAEMFKCKGAKIASHDPSDLGKDDKGYCVRHGSVITKVKARDYGDVNEGCDWATDEALKDGVDIFRWDGDGMGAGLKQQVAQAFEELQVEFEPFYGSISGKGIDDPDDVYIPAETTGKRPKTNKETFRNKRSQNYWKLRDRCYNTYLAVKKGRYIDPDEMISFDSEGIENIAQLRSEICRIPLKRNANGFIQIMSKDDMLRLDIPSPNLSDSVMMTMPSPVIVAEEPESYDIPDAVNYYA